MMGNQVLVQLIGFIAFLFIVLSFQNNKRSLILLFLIIAQTSFPRLTHFHGLESGVFPILTFGASAPYPSQAQHIRRTHSFLLDTGNSFL